MILRNVSGGEAYAPNIFKIDVICNRKMILDLGPVFILPLPTLMIMMVFIFCEFISITKSPSENHFENHIKPMVWVRTSQFVNKYIISSQEIISNYNVNN